MSITIGWEEFIKDRIWIATHDGRQVAEVHRCGNVCTWFLKEGVVNGTAYNVRAACNIAGLAYEWCLENM